MTRQRAVCETALAYSEDCEGAVTYVAFDLETIPGPLAEKRMGIELKPGVDIRQLSKLTSDLKKFSTSTVLARIVAAGVCGVIRGQQIEESWVARTEEDERALLQELWRVLARAHRNGATIVTFNGMEFDVPLLYTRSTALAVEPKIRFKGFTYPYQTHPHFDIRRVLNNWDRRALGRFEEVCELLGIKNPKNVLGGALVLHAVLNDQWDDIREYVLADVRAMGEVFERVAPVYL